MRGLIAAGAVALAAGGVAVAMPAGATTGTPEGCVLASGTTSSVPGQNVGGTSCTYSATATESYAGVGSYTVTVTHADATTCTDTATGADPSRTALCTIGAGDSVSASVGDNSGLAIGSPTGDDFPPPGPTG